MTSQELNQLLVLRLDVLGAYVQLDCHLILCVSLDIQANVKVEQIQWSVQNDLIVPIHHAPYLVDAHVAFYRIQDCLACVVVADILQISSYFFG